jgi:PAS domain-containing protein
MMIFNSSCNVNGHSYLLVNKEVIVEVSEPFAAMTEYSAEELIGRSINELFSVLKVGPCIDVGDIHTDRDYFLFTKSLEVRFINVYVFRMNIIHNTVDVFMVWG